MKIYDNAKYIMDPKIILCFQPNLVYTGIYFNLGKL